MLDCRVVADDDIEPGDVRVWIFAVMRFESEGRRGEPRGSVAEGRVLESVVAFLRALVILFLECFGVRWICWTCLRALSVWIFEILHRKRPSAFWAIVMYRKRPTLDLGHVDAEMVALLEYALATLVDEKIESLGEASHAIAQIVETKLDARELVEH